jgi:hypothetical protein
VIASWNATDNGVIRVHRAFCAAVVGVARAVLFKDVVDAVVQAPKTQCRASVIVLGSVIENYVENDFNTSPGVA